MPIPGLGHKSYLQIGEEVTWGTGVAATKKLTCLSMSVEPIIGVIDDNSLWNAASRRVLLQGGLTYRGRFVVVCYYEGLLKLWKWAMGSGVTTGPVDSAYTHTFKEASTLGSLTIEMIEGDIATGLEQELVGCKCVSMTIRGAAGQGNDGLLMVEFEVLAKDKLIGQTPTAALVFPNLLYETLFHQGITVLEGSGDSAANIRVRNFEITLLNPQDPRWYIGSLNIDEPLRSDFLECRWRITQEFFTTALLTKAKAFTGGVLQLIFQHPTLIGASSKREIEFRSNFSQISDYGNPVAGYGVILQTTTWRCVQDPTDVSALVVRAKTPESAI